MLLLTEAQRLRLLQNGANPDRNHAPVAWVSIPQARCQWLLSELDPDDPDMAFGLCDLGYPELGYVSLGEIIAVSKQLGLAVFSKAGFEARHPMSVYARAARIAGSITLDPHLLALCLAEPVRQPVRSKPPQP